MRTLLFALLLSGCSSDPTACDPIACRDTVRLAIERAGGFTTGQALVRATSASGLVREQRCELTPVLACTGDVSVDASLSVWRDGAGLVATWWDDAHPASVRFEVSVLQGSSVIGDAALDVTPSWAHGQGTCDACVRTDAHLAVP